MMSTRWQAMGNGNLERDRARAANETKRAKIDHECEKARAKHKPHHVRLGRISIHSALEECERLGAASHRGVSILAALTSRGGGYGEWGRKGLCTKGYGWGCTKRRVVCASLCTAAVVREAKMGHHGPGRVSAGSHALTVGHVGLDELQKNSVHAATASACTSADKRFRQMQTLRPVTRWLRA